MGQDCSLSTVRGSTANITAGLEGSRDKGEGEEAIGDKDEAEEEGWG